MKRTLSSRFMRYMSRVKWLSNKRRFELYPPMWLMRIKVLEMSDDWKNIRILLPLNTVSRNPGGVMFGGYQAALADPIAALACSESFPDYEVWTRAMSIDFRKGGSTDLELRFALSDEQLAEIRAELDEKGKATPTIEYGFYLSDGTQCTHISNTVAIRPKGYAKATTPAASLDEIK